jgi:hypothetical protein
MNGFNNLVLPFRLNFREVAENKEVVLNGLSVIQRFFHGNIWLPLDADVETLFVRGVLGATDNLCDWFEVLSFWPVFEPEKDEEKEHLWCVFFQKFQIFILLYNFLVFVLFFFCLKKAAGRFSVLPGDFLGYALQDSLVAGVSARRFSSVGRRFPFSVGS